jgi:hypothetical protein
VVELVGFAGFDDADIIDDLGEVREKLGKLCAAVAVFCEFEARAEDGGVGADEGVALVSVDGGGEGLALHFCELGFVVEEVELGGGACHEEVDHALGAGEEVGGFGKKCASR